MGSRGRGWQAAAGAGGGRWEERCGFLGRGRKEVADEGILAWEPRIRLPPEMG